MDEDSDKAPNQSSISSGSAGTGVNDRKRKSEAEHPDYIERVHEKSLVAEVTKKTRRKMRKYDEGTS